MAKLGDICTINMGQSPESSSYNTIGEGLPFFQGNADFGDIHPTIRTWCSNPIKIAEKGDLLISVRAPIGALNIANNQCCIGRGLAALTNYTKNIYKDYLWFALLSKINELNSKGTGSTFKAINKKILAETDISLPSLEKQKQIAKQLSCLDTLLSKRKQQLSKLDQLVKSRFIEMFGEAQTNSKNFPILPWRNIFFTTTGKLDSNTMVENGQYPFFTCSKDILHINTYAFDCEALLLAGNNASGIYDVKHYKGKFNAYQRTYVLRLKNEKWSYKLFKQQLEDKLLYLRNQSKGTNTRYLTLGILNNLQFIVPPIDEQKKFTSFVQQVDKAKSSVKQSFEKLETLKKSLMQEYFG